jgi:glycosyltransferase involved in cell wall biosynthesis
VRIAFVAPAYPYRGGIAHFAVRLAQEASAENDILFVNFSRLYPRILFPGKTQFDHSATEINFPSERIIDSINPATWIQASNRIQEWGADAVVFHYWHSFFSPAYGTIAKQIGPETVRIAICHNVVPHDAGNMQTLLARFAFSKMSGFIVHSQSEVKDLLRLSPEARYKVAFHPIYDVFPNEDMPKSEARSKMGLADDLRVVLYFGLIRPYKGVDLLIKAVTELSDVPNLKVLIVGEVYSDRAMLNNLLKTVPADRIELIDRYIPNEQVATFFRAADLVALPYRSATQSGIVPIAYRCNRPVLVTRVGGLPDVVVEGVSGYLIPPADASAIAKAIRRHFLKLGNPSMNEGIARVREKLSWGRYYSVLSELILSSSGAR